MKRKPRVGFCRNETASSKLELNRVMPERYLLVMGMIKDFYSKLSASKRYREAMERFGVFVETLCEAFGTVVEG
jgi:hypothetical protein